MSSNPRETGLPPMRAHGTACDRSLLLVLSAPSGTGKTTLARRLVAAHPGARFSISVTTRAPRGREQDGVDYRFVSGTRFREMVSEDAFIEWAEVHGNFYGTPRDLVASARSDGGIVVFDIDVQGGEQIKARYPEAVTVLVVPPGYAELERRLRARGTDDEPVISRRLLAAQSEIRRAQSYDYCILNDDLERAYGELEAIVTAERLRTRRLGLTALGF